MTKDDFMNPLIWVGVLFLLVAINQLGAYLGAFWLPPKYLYIFVAIAFALLFVILFTIPLAKREQTVRENLIRYAYVFMFLALGAAMAPAFYTHSDSESAKRPISVLVGCNTTSSETSELSCQKKNEARRQWVLNVGGYAKQCSSSVGESTFCVDGGLVVPIYFVIVALLGGAVSITRRVPEYQKQSTPDYKGNEKQPFIDTSELREYLVFQILQFLSAPLVAIVAYNFVDPSNRAYGVALAFASGFASETILLMIRAIVEKIKPERTMPGDVMGSILDSQQRIVSTATVKLVGSNKSTKVDGNGHYILAGVPPGSHIIEATTNGTSKTATLNVRSGEVHICHITL